MSIHETRGLKEGLTIDFFCSFLWEGEAEYHYVLQCKNTELQKKIKI